MRIYLKVATWAAVCSMFVMTVICTDLGLTGDPVSVVESDLLTMSCSKTTDTIPPLTVVMWHRNTESIFQTVRGEVLPDDSNTTEYDQVSGRIGVTTNQQEHKVMLRINSSLDDGSVWRCSVDVHYSNNLNVVMNLTTYPTGINGMVTSCSVLEDKATSNRTSTGVIIGSVFAGVVIVTIIITLVVFLMKMNRSKQTQQPDNHVYDSTDDVARETNDTSGHEYNAYLTALERDTSYYNVISN